MTDADLVARKLAFIETYVHDLRTRAEPNRVLDDVVMRRFVEHTLQVAIQAALDVASHIVAEQRLAEPSTNQQLMRTIADAGWVPPALAGRLAQMAGFRNVLVHGYAEVAPEIVKDAVEHRLGDLDDFVAVIRQRLDAG